VAALVKLDAGRDGRLAWQPMQLNSTPVITCDHLFILYLHTCNHIVFLTI